MVSISARVIPSRGAYRGSPVLVRGAAAEERGTRKTPGVPEGTPILPPSVIPSRPRRNRRSRTAREGLCETSLSPKNLILPVFIHEDEDDWPIESLPGVERLGEKGLLREVAKGREYGVNQVILFPKTPQELKSSIGEEAFNPNGLVQRRIRSLKEAFPDLEIYTDVALDPYNIDGHDGIVRDDGVVLNDETVEFLCRQALSQAEAGADVVAPSDMMDGRVSAIREALDENGFSHVSIMSYSAKYASAFYGPFRDALGSAPSLGSKNRVIPGDKKTYQMDPGNYREALREGTLDEAEGADILLVKPGLPYLDIIRALKDNFLLPVSAYQVSGEYAMIKAAAERGWLNEKDCVLETLMCLRRAGADLILTYHGIQAAKWMLEE